MQEGNVKGPAIVSYQQWHSILGRATPVNEVQKLLSCLPACYAHTQTEALRLQQMLTALAKEFKMA